MIELNLYPWRSKKEKIKKRWFYSAMVSALLAPSFGLVFSLNQQINIRTHLRHDIIGLQRAAAHTLAKTPLNPMIPSTITASFFEQVLRYWQWQLNLFATLAAKPNELCFTALQFSTKGMTLLGTAASHFILWDYLEHVVFIDNLSNARLTALKQNPITHAMDFELNAVTEKTMRPFLSHPH